MARDLWIKRFFYLFLLAIVVNFNIVFAKTSSSPQLKDRLIGTEEELDSSWPKFGNKHKILNSNEYNQNQIKEIEQKNVEPTHAKVNDNENYIKSDSEGDPSILKKRRVSTFSPKLRTHSAGLGLGQTFLSGDFKNNGDDRVTPDFYYAYTASYSFDVIGNLHYSKHRQGNKSVSIMGAVAAIKSRLYTYDSLSTFVLGGLGFYSPRTSKNDNGLETFSSGRTVFGTNFGAGLDLSLNSQVTVGALLHYHNPFDVKEDNGSALDGSYYKLLLTLMYSF